MAVLIPVLGIPHSDNPANTQKAPRAEVPVGLFCFPFPRSRSKQKPRRHFGRAGLSSRVHAARTGDWRLSAGTSEPDFVRCRSGAGDVAGEAEI